MATITMKRNGQDFVFIDGRAGETDIKAQYAALSAEGKIDLIAARLGLK